MIRDKFAYNETRNMLVTDQSSDQDRSQRPTANGDKVARIFFSLPDLNSGLKTAFFNAHNKLYESYFFLSAYIYKTYIYNHTSQLILT